MTSPTGSSTPPVRAFLCGCLLSTPVCSGCGHQAHANLCDVPTHPIAAALAAQADTASSEAPDLTVHDLAAIEGVCAVHVGSLRAGPMAREIVEALNHRLPRASSEAEGLDVERLARALRKTYPEHLRHSNEDQLRGDAQFLATEYGGGDHG